MSNEPTLPIQQRRSGAIVNDPELLAMHRMVEILDELDRSARERVVRWLASRHAEGLYPNGGAD